MHRVRVAALGSVVVGVALFLQGCTQDSAKLFLAILFFLLPGLGANGTQAQLEVGAAGGVVSLENFELVLPPGVFGNTTLVTVEKSENQSVFSHPNLVFSAEQIAIQFSPATPASSSVNAGQSGATNHARTQQLIGTVPVQLVFTIPLHQLRQRASNTLNELRDSLRLIVSEATDAALHTGDEIVDATTIVVDHVRGVVVATYEMRIDRLVRRAQSVLRWVGYVDNCENAAFGQYFLGELQQVPGFATGAREHVVFVHGITAVPAMWDTFLSELKSQNIDVLPYTSFYCTARSVIENGSLLDEALSRLDVSTFDEINLVAHSMGGLVAKAAILHAIARGSSWLAKLHGVVTLGTPHDGTSLADKTLFLPTFLFELGTPASALAAYLLVASEGLRNMRHGSETIHSLAVSHIYDQADFYAVGGSTSMGSSVLNVTTNSVFPDPDDGAVPSSSALGLTFNPALSGNSNNRTDTFALNHFQYAQDMAVFGNIVSFLDLSVIGAPPPSPSMHSHPWPHPFANAKNNSQSSVSGPTTSTLSCVATLSGDVSAPPVVGFDGTTYVALFDAQESRILALNADGTQKWVSSVLEINKAIDHVVLDSTGALYVGYDDGNATFFALDTVDGSITWSKPNQPALHVSIAPSGLIIIGLFKDYVAYRPDGSFAWQTSSLHCNANSCSTFQGKPAFTSMGEMYVLDFHARIFGSNRLYLNRLSVDSGLSLSSAVVGGHQLATVLVVDAHDTVFIHTPINFNDLSRFDTSLVRIKQLFSPDPILSTIGVAPSGEVLVLVRDSVTSNLLLRALHPDSLTLSWEYDTGETGTIDPVQALSIGSDGTAYFNVAGTTGDKLFAVRAGSLIFDLALSIEHKPAIATNQTLNVIVNDAGQKRLCVIGS